jgi:nucleotide-binding universal stress UspA family protein
METELGILVAVGPDGLGDGTLNLAASEALRRGMGVELLHVIHAVVVRVPPRVDEETDVDRLVNKVGREVLSSAADRMRQRVGDRVAVDANLLYGPIGSTIGDRGSKGQLIVLERRDVGTLERVLTMSVSSRVAAHASVPVLVVPHSWSSERASRLPITVGVTSTDDIRSEVPQTLEFARATGRPLVVFHASWIAEPYQPAVFSDYSPERWVADTRREFEPALADVVGPDDDVTLDVRWARPVDALIDATRRSAQLVLGRRTATRPLAAHLGPVTRAVLHHAECPVLVVDRALVDESSLTSS